MEDDLTRSESKVPLQAELFPDMVTEYNDGRDELNLAEFPISAIGSRSDPNIKTLRFEDRFFDKSAGAMVDRKLIVTASDEYGLPTTADDEVLLGLLQISRLQKFESPTVAFTPYQLLRILGWSVSTYNYRRIREAINRWVGVTLYYDNAWRDKKTGQWVEAKFHFIEFVEFYKQGNESVFAPDGASVIKWNDLIFRNFCEGNLKTLDFHLYRALESGIAKRLFRFLDKRFYHRKRLVFALEVFACDKIGLTRPIKVSTSGKTTVDVAQIKRRLLPAIKELEEQKFIFAKDPEDRFTKDPAGVWQVHFERYIETDERQPQQPVLEIAVEDVGLLEGRLIGHGVTNAQARRLVSEYDDERIEQQLDALEFLLAKGGEGAPQNRAGWLVKGITENYGPPRGFKSRGQIAHEAQEKAERAKAKEEARRKKQEQEEARKASEAERYAADEKKVETYLASLTDKEREKLEADALKDSPFAMGRTGSPFRRALIHSHILELLSKLTDSTD